MVIHPCFNTSVEKQAQYIVLRCHSIPHVTFECALCNCAIVHFSLFVDLIFFRQDCLSSLPAIVSFLTFQTQDIPQDISNCLVSAILIFSLCLTQTHCRQHFQALFLCNPGMACLDAPLQRMPLHRRWKKEGCSCSVVTGQVKGMHCRVTFWCLVFFFGIWTHLQ